MSRSLALLIVSFASCGGQQERTASSDSTQAADEEPEARAEPAAVEAQPLEAQRSEAQPDASAYQIDGFRLGDIYSSVGARPPYDAPCDNDAIDERARRFMVYGARPCRDHTFPEGTTVAFYVGFRDGPGALDAPIEAFAWMGGAYFSSRSDFPLHTGEPVARAEEVLGPTSATFSLSRDDDTLVVRKHAGEVYSLEDGGTLVGFVLGPMPADAENEQWRGLMQMYTRYTIER